MNYCRGRPKAEPQLKYSPSLNARLGKVFTKATLFCHSVPYHAADSAQP